MTWNFAPPTSGQSAILVAHTNNEPLQVRGAVDQLMQMFGASKQFAVSSTGTINANGTGNLTITVTAS